MKIDEMAGALNSALTKAATDLEDVLLDWIGSTSQKVLTAYRNDLDTGYASNDDEIRLHLDIWNRMKGKAKDLYMELEKGYRELPIYEADMPAKGIQEGHVGSPLN